MSSNAPVQSVDRILDIIELLSLYPSGLLLRDLAQVSKLHTSTVHRLLSCLIARGYARKDPRSGKYCLTLRFFEIGCAASGALDLVAVAREQLDELSDFSKEVVHLVKRDGLSVVYLYKAEPSQSLVRMSSRVGGRNPLYCTAVGRSILANLPEDEVNEIWELSDITPVTSKTITNLEALKSQLAIAKKKGYAIDNEENEEGVYCLAAPIFNWKGEPIAAISVSAPLNRMVDENKARILPVLIKTAQNISYQLGYIQPEMP
jgi:IclR family KDG regulon transcriptional repressor